MRIAVTLLSFLGACAYGDIEDPDLQRAKKTAAENQATRNTSRAIAQALLGVVPSPG